MITTKWKYKVMCGDNIVSHYLDDLGLAGWEMCGVSKREGDGEPIFYFKQAIPTITFAEAEYPSPSASDWNPQR